MEEEVLELKEWDEGQASINIGYATFLTHDKHWELTFLYICVFLFSIWFGITAKTFENIMEFCIISLIMASILYVLGQISTEDPFRHNSQSLFPLTIFFIICVSIFHFLRLRIEPQTIT